MQDATATGAQAYLRQWHLAFKYPRRQHGGCALLAEALPGAGTLAWINAVIDLQRTDACAQA